MYVGFWVFFNFHMEMWRKHAHTLEPLTKICSTKVKFKWNGIKKNPFMEIKNIVVREILLSYTNSSEEFINHTDDYKTKTGGLIIQNGKTVLFYARKLTPSKVIIQLHKYNC